MKTYTATQAAKNFGQILDNARSGHVTIEKQGRPVAVLYSYDEAVAIEEMKMRDLKSALEAAQAEARAGKGRPFTKEVLTEIKERGMKRLEQLQDN